MNEEIIMQSSSQVKELANGLKEDATFYSSLVSQLENAKTQLKANWEGDSADIQSIILKIDVVVNGFNALIPNINDMAEALIEHTISVETASDATVEDPVIVIPPEEGGSGGSNPNPNPNPGNETGTSGKLGFWEYHKENFKNDWDYSGCDSGLDYIGATVDGLVGTVGSTVNFVVDGCSELLGWFFG